MTIDNARIYQTFVSIADGSLIVRTRNRREWEKTSAVQA